MKDQYKEPNKEKERDGFKNRRGVDILADLFGGLTGKAVKSKRKHKERLNK